MTVFQQPPALSNPSGRGRSVKAALDYVVPGIGLLDRAVRESSTSPETQNICCMHRNTSLMSPVLKHSVSIKVCCSENVASFHKNTHLAQPLVMGQSLMRSQKIPITMSQGDMILLTCSNPCPPRRGKDLEFSLTNPDNMLLLNRRDHYYPGKKLILDSSPVLLSPSRGHQGANESEQNPTRPRLSPLPWKRRARLSPSKRRR